MTSTSTSILAGEFSHGKRQVVEANFSNIEHCLVTEVLEYNLTLQRADGTDGIYTESLKRDGNAGTCPVSATSAPHYAVKLDRTLNSDDAYIAYEIFRNYQQKSSHVCGDIKPVSHKRLILDSNGNGAVFDGIFRERIE
jgi:hypothetical protein